MNPLQFLLKMARLAGKPFTIIGAIIMMTASAFGAPKFLLKTPQEYFQDGKSQALLSAALGGDLEKAKWLVAQGADPNDEGPRSNPYNRLRLLHYAVAAKNTQAVKVLYAVGADPEVLAIGFGNALQFAMTLKDLEMVSLLLDLRPVNRLSNQTIDYILFDTVTDRCPECLELLLQRGVPIDFPDASGYTVMMDAIAAEDYDMAEWLLKKGASVHVEAKGGVTPPFSVEFHLKKYKPGSPPFNKLLQLKKMMEERGAVFPALTPEQVKAKRTER